MALTHTDTGVSTLRINKFPSKEMFEQALAQHLIDENQISVILGDFDQADWDQSSPTSPEYIKNRTHYRNYDNTYGISFNSWTSPDTNIVTCEEEMSIESGWFRLMTSFHNLSAADQYKPEEAILASISSLTIGSYDVITGPVEVRGFEGDDVVYPAGMIMPYVGNFKLYLDYMDAAGVPLTIDPDDYDTGEDYVVFGLGCDSTEANFQIMTNNSNYGLDTTPLPSINMVLNLPTIVTIPLGFIPDIPLSKLYPEIPTPTSSDEGKLLSVDSDGNFELVTIVNSENIPY